MIRFVIIAAILIVLGVLTTIAVSWWCAMNIDPAAAGHKPSSAHAAGDAEAPYAEWTLMRRRTGGYEEVMSMWTDKDRQAGLTVHPIGDPMALLPRWASGLTPHDVDAITDRHVRIAHAWGWPMVALWYVQEGDSVSPAPPFVGRTKYAIETSPVTRKRPTHIVLAMRYLPLRPAWAGVIVDSIFYALLWLPMYGLLLLALRRRGRLRLKRGRCPKCKYDLRGAEHTMCPECGARIRAPAE